MPFLTLPKVFFAIFVIFISILLRSADHDWIIISSSDGILALGEKPKMYFTKVCFSKFNGMHFVSEGPVKQ